MPGPSLSAIIVAHDSVADLEASLPPLLAQLEPRDELIVVDSGSSDGLDSALPRIAPTAQLVAPGANIGFAGGANVGAAAASGELLVFLNPDAVVQPGWAAAIRDPGVDFDAWMGLVTMDGGRVVNTSGGVLHFTGIGWAGQAGRPVSEAATEPHEVAFLSGACLAIPAERWHAVGGFASHYFMYCEDVDLSLRLRLRGGRLGVIPAAQVIHAYDFDKGARKWRLLERNRWATIVRDYPALLLALLAPALLATELAIWAAALRGGWAPMKARASLDVLRTLPRLLGERRAIQRTRAVGAAVLAAPMTAELSSPYLGDVTAPVRFALRAYWHAVLATLEALAAR